MWDVDTHLDTNTKKKNVRMLIKCDRKNSKIIIWYYKFPENYRKMLLKIAKNKLFNIIFSTLVTALFTIFFKNFQIEENMK